MKVHIKRVEMTFIGAFTRRGKCRLNRFFVNRFTFFGIINAELYDVHSYYFYNRRVDSLCFAQASDFVVFGRLVPLVGFNMNALFNAEVILPLVMLKMLRNIHTCVKYWIWSNSLKRRGECIITL